MRSALLAIKLARIASDDQFGYLFNQLRNDTRAAGRAPAIVMRTIQPRRKPKKATDPLDKSFLEVARELGCSEDEKTFDKVLRKIASAPSPMSVQKRKKRTKGEGSK